MWSPRWISREKTSRHYSNSRSCCNSVVAPADARLVLRVSQRLFRGHLLVDHSGLVSWRQPDSCMFFHPCCRPTFTSIGPACAWSPWPHTGLRRHYCGTASNSSPRTRRPGRQSSRPQKEKSSSSESHNLPRRLHWHRLEKGLLH